MTNSVRRHSTGSQQRLTKIGSDLKRNAQPSPFTTDVSIPPQFSCVSSVRSVVGSTFHRIKCAIIVCVGMINNHIIVSVYRYPASEF